MAPPYQLDKVRQRLLARTKVCQLPASSKQRHVVKHAKDFVPRLVDDAHDSNACQNSQTVGEQCGVSGQSRVQPLFVTASPLSLECQLYQCLPAGVAPSWCAVRLQSQAHWLARQAAKVADKHQQARSGQLAEVVEVVVMMKRAYKQDTRVGHQLQANVDALALAS